MANVALVLSLISASYITQSCSCVPLTTETLRKTTKLFRFEIRKRALKVVNRRKGCHSALMLLLHCACSFGKSACGTTALQLVETDMGKSFKTTDLRIWCECIGWSRQWISVSHVYWLQCYKVHAKVVKPIHNSNTKQNNWEMRWIEEMRPKTKHCCDVLQYCMNVHQNQWKHEANKQEMQTDNLNQIRFRRSWPVGSGWR